MNLNIIILAAGHGTRMNSSIPKVLHKIANKPILSYIIDKCILLKPNKIIIVCGYLGDEVIQYVKTNYQDCENLIFAKQLNQCGTADAVKSAIPYLDNASRILVLCGDTPLISLDTLSKIVDMSYSNNLILLTTILEVPYGYGRVVRGADNKVIKIIEEKDVIDSEKQIKEINSGIYVFNSDYLIRLLLLIDNNNKQQEFYLTDMISLAVTHKIEVIPYIVDNPNQIMGINNKYQLEIAERVYQESIVTELLNHGLTLLDKKRIDIRGELIFGRDCCIDINCIFIGKVVLGNNVRIMANCIIKDSVIGDDTEVKANSVIEESTIGNNASIGPFARIRPQTNIDDYAHIGNFVEIKKSNVGKYSKINHLTYIGDANIGSNVNIGAGSVTCNYDGVSKHNTIIGSNVFVGSGSMLVAPVELGDGAIIGAGSVITKNAPEDELTISRSKQVTVIGWKKKYRNT